MPWQTWYEEVGEVILIDRPKEQVEEDSFGFAEDARVVADAIANSEERGYAVGVFGPWGSGKSSFMNFMACHLRAKRIPCVEFIAWQYDRYESLLAALVREMLRQPTQTVDGRNRLQYLAPKLLSSAFVLGVGGLGTVTGGAVNLDMVHRLGRIWSGPDTPYDMIVDFKESFCEVSKALGGGKPVLVFLDDLDRCLPDNVVAILDALKLLLFDSNCVFVVGVDRDVVEHAVCMRYGTGELPYGRAYLDKIVDVQVRIPAVSGHLLESGLLVGDEHKALSQGERQILFSAAAGNPRRVLRLLNALAASRDTGSGRSTTEIGRLAEVLAVSLRMAYPDCYAACLTNPDKAPEAFGVLADTSSSRAKYIGANGLEAYEGLLKDGHLAAFLRTNHSLLNKNFGTAEERATLTKALLTAHAE